MIFAKHKDQMVFESILAKLYWIPQGTYNGRLFAVWEMSFLQKKNLFIQPRDGCAVSSQRDDGSSCSQAIFFTLIYESVQELIILQIA